MPASPNGNETGDGLANVTSHEQFESVTDSQADLHSAWYDAAGEEIGEKCSRGFSLGETHLAHGGVFELQAEYSDASSSCVNAYR